MPLPRFRSGLFELLELLEPRPELLDDEPLLPRLLLRSELLEDEPVMPLFELLMSSPLFDDPEELPELPVLPVLPVLPTLERSLLRVLPTLLEAPKPLWLLLLEPLPEFDGLLLDPL